MFTTEVPTYKICSPLIVVGIVSLRVPDEIVPMLEPIYTFSPSKLTVYTVRLSPCRKTWPLVG